MRGAAAAVGGGVVLLHGHGGEVGIGIIKQGKGLFALQAALVHAQDFSVGRKQYPAGIHADAGGFGQAAVIEGYLKTGIIELAEPFFKFGFRLFAEKAGRGHGNQVGTGVFAGKFGRLLPFGGGLQLA